MNVTPITPITELRVLRGVYLNPSYSDSQTYASASARDSYFINKTKFVYNNLVPVRNNTIKLPIAVDDLYDCGYVMYKNANFNDKWFYCYISKKTWKNAKCCEISLQTDVITTWMFDWNLHPSYVVRKHVNSDNIGENTVPEQNINTSIKIKRSVESSVLSTDTGVSAMIFYLPRDGDVEAVQDQLHPFAMGDVFCACAVKTYNEANWKNMYQDIIKPLAEDGLMDNIVGIQMVPTKLCAPENGGLGTEVWQDTYYLTDGVNKTKLWTLDGYVPYNKKLLTFPYNSLMIVTSDGVQQEFAIENFVGDRCNFYIFMTQSFSPMIISVPNNYGNETHDFTRAFQDVQYYSIVKNMPMGFYSGISGLAYIQNQITGLMNSARDYLTSSSSVFSSMGGIKVPNAVDMTGLGGRVLNGMLGATGTSANNAATAAMNNIAGDISNLGNMLGEGIGLLSQGFSIPNTPISVYPEPMQQAGTVPSGTTSYTVNFGNFYYVHSSIRQESAIWADRMLTRWGYAINSVSDVNINGREVFNHIQTKDLLVTGNIPPEDLMEIKRIFENGITFWHVERGHEIGSWDGRASTNPII